MQPSSQTSFLDKTGTRVRDPRGGFRDGAGRKRTGKRANLPHRRREAFRPNEPLHITLRVASDVGSLRRRFMYAALRAATVVASVHSEARIIHLSVQRTHIHLIVEAASRTALGKAMKSLQGSAAKHINRTVSRRSGTKRTGRVFSDRYHLEVLRTPRQVRHALQYVLNNWRKHGDHRDDGVRGWRVDPWSTGYKFDGWREGLHLDHQLFPADFQHFVVWDAKVWLLTAGWRKHGLIPVREKPGARAFARTQAARDQRVWRLLERERERDERLWG